MPENLTISNNLKLATNDSERHGDITRQSAMSVALVVESRVTRCVNAYTPIGLNWGQGNFCFMQYKYSLLNLNTPDLWMRGPPQGVTAMSDMYRTTQ